MNREAFFNAVRVTLFGGRLSASQVRGMELILGATDHLPKTFTAYILATAYHETARTFAPLREAMGASDADTIRRLDRAFASGKLPWVSKPYWRPDADGKAWFGRGLVQLTHKANYVKAGKMLGLDLVSDPSAAMNPFTATSILVRGSVEGWFTTKKLADFLPGDYVGARAVINGKDRATDIAAYALKFERALTLADNEATAPVRPDVEPADQKPIKKPSTSQTPVLAAVAALIAAVVAYFVKG